MLVLIFGVLALDHILLSTCVVYNEFIVIKLYFSKSLLLFQPAFPKFKLYAMILTPSILHEVELHVLFYMSAAIAIIPVTLSSSSWHNI